MNNIFDQVFKSLKRHKINVIDKDINRPWGGFLVISNNNSEDFINIYFNGSITKRLKVSSKLSFKILIIAPNKRLSWQYHNRRSEIWKVVNGKIKVVTSYDDKERNEKILNDGDEIKLSEGERHRIIGIDDYSIVAEIWIHTDKANPSDEDDIVRVQDDYNR